MAATDEIQDIGNQEPPPQTPPLPQEPPADKVKAVYDAVSQDYDLGDYDAFRKKMDDPVKRKALYDTVSGEYEIGNTFDDFEKKLETTIGPVRSTIESTRSNYKTATDDPDIYLPLTATVKKQSEIDPQFAATKAEAQKVSSQNISNISKSWGVDPKDVTKVITDFPDQNDPVNLKTHVQQLKDNPLEYERYRAADENKNLIAKSPDGGVHAANLYNDLQGDEAQPIQGIKNLQETIEQQRQIIYSSLTGSERGKALDNLAANKGVFFNAADPEIQDMYAKDTELNKDLTPVQYAGIQYLKSFNPDQYDQYIKLLKTETDSDVLLRGGATNPITGEVTKSKEQNKLLSQKIGTETIKQNLLNIGRQNTQAYITEQVPELNKQYNATEDPDAREAIRQKFSSLQSMMTGIRDDVKNDESRFPYLADLKFDNQVKELTQDPGIHPLDYAFQRFKSGYLKSDEGIDNVITALVGSKKQNDINQLTALGSAQKEASDFYMPESLKAEGSPFIYQFGKDMKDAAKVIQNDDSLSDEQKKYRLTNLVKSNQDKIDFITNPNAGKSANVFSKSTLYRNAGMVGDIAAFAAQTAGLGAAGAGRILSQGLPMFLSAQSDFYKEAVAEGQSNPSTYANLHAAVMFAAGTINPDLAIVKRALGGTSSTLSKTISGISEDSWNKIIAGNKPLLSKITSSISSVTKEAAKMGSVYGAGTSIANDIINQQAFDKNIDTSQITENAVKATRDILTSSLGILGLNAITHFRNISPDEKAHIWDLGHNPKIGLEKIDESVSNGELTEQQGDQRKAIIKNVSKLVDKVPVNDVKGNPLTDRQRTDILYNMIIKGKIGEMKGDLPEATADKLAGISTLLDIDTGEKIDPGSAKGTVIKALNDLKFGDKSPWKTVEGNGSQMLKDLQEQATGWHKSTDEVGDPKSFNNLHNAFPPHLIEAAIRALPDEDKQHILDMHEVAGHDIPGKLREFLHVNKIEEPKISENATTEQGPNEMDVRQQTGNGTPMGSGDAEHQIATGTQENQGQSTKATVIMPSENKPPKVITPIKKEKIPFDDFRDEMLGQYENQKSSAFDWRITNDTISQSEREKGIKDIREGKKSAAARKIEKHIKEMYDQGVVPMNRGRGTSSQYRDFSFDDLGHMMHTVNGIEKGIHDWLDEQSSLTPIDTEFLHSNIDNTIEQHGTGTKGQAAEPASGTPQQSDQIPGGETVSPQGQAEPIAAGPGQGPGATAKPGEPEGPGAAQLMIEKNKELNRVTKPKAKLDLLKPDEVAAAKDVEKTRSAHNEIKEKYKSLKSLIDCLWD